MLKQINVTNRRGMTLQLEMLENDSGYQIADVEGLNPVKAVLSSSSSAGLDGEKFQSARRGARYIKIKLDLEPDFVTDDFSSLRKKLYSYFPTKQEVVMRYIMTEALYVDITGVVEDVDVEQFQEEQQVVISLTCYEPDFIDPRMVTVEALTVSTMTHVEIDYAGDIEAGTVLTLNVNRSMDGFTIYNTGEDGIVRQLDFTAPLLDGDQLVISSLRGNKGITLTRLGVSKSYLYGKTTQTGWIELVEGLNQFRVYATGAGVPYVLEYLPRYGAL